MANTISRTEDIMVVNFDTAQDEETIAELEDCGWRKVTDTFFRADYNEDLYEATKDVFDLKEATSKGKAKAKAVAKEETIAPQSKSATKAEAKEKPKLKMPKGAGVIEVEGAKGIGMVYSSEADKKAGEAFFADLMKQAKGDASAVQAFLRSMMKGE